MIRKCIVYIRKFIVSIRLRKYHHISNTAHIARGVKVYNPNNLIMEDYTNVNGGTIMNTRATVTFKKYAGAAFGVTIITGNHMSVPGLHHKMITSKLKDELDTLHEYDKDIVIGEDVWLGANSTLLSGVKVGRGAIVGAGSVVRCDIPPYAIVAGNPAKIVGFRFTPSLTLLHEEELYPVGERIPEELLQENYKKYFVSKIKDIQHYLSL